MVERKLRAKQGLAAIEESGLLALNIVLAQMRGEPLLNRKMPAEVQLQAAAADAVVSELPETSARPAPDGLANNMPVDRRPSRTPPDFRYRIDMPQLL